MTTTFYRTYLLPWDPATEDESRFREIVRWTAVGTLVLALLLSILPVPERGRDALQPVPPRLARLVLEKPAPLPPPVVQPVEQVVEQRQPEPEMRPEPVAPLERVVETRARSEQPAEPVHDVRERAGRAGLLPFADTLATLRNNEALSTITSGSTAYTGAVGEAPQVERSLITSRAGVGSGGINTAGMSRNTGGAGLEGRATTKVASGVAALGGGSASRGAGRAEGSGDGQRGARSREEIEMVFDQNKGAIYALYNRALRANPALQGKLVLKLTIEASGQVSDCQIVSSELGDDELERKLVQRIKMFRFVARDVPPVTTTKPIDFFPA